ncbi:hypothetical protein CXF83_05385 [Shewanella sp. Choline-02u-19]|jgi:hypothetical protein|uniref:hypothetical protein n=1 Tax=unclassified Shewanella TaxID=196818 RepID=UPI000C3336F1|nr:MULTISPECIES: hypothetical protein [unclassified Shewanella]PKG76192.1 hypothetical protein CXF86_04610 [Shewanella sp. GutCb]PKH56281.1 hypothetical protein CXF84_14055 [Shewanella sp. Bg11-22]PKI30075.1 hypothetical protein CXF83_05385 [Shewanella sp. Choline-02u-19]
MLSEPVASFFAPYQQLNLPAYDNLKLVVAVLTEKDEECHALEAELMVDGKQENSYLVRWKKHFIYCGRTNSYANKIDEVADLAVIDAESIVVLQPAVLSMQQVSFMCMENSHFDHC